VAIYGRFISNYRPTRAKHFRSNFLLLLCFPIPFLHIYICYCDILWFHFRDKYCVKMNNAINIGHCNVYHLGNKLHDVCRLLSGPPCLHILGLSETRLDIQPDSAHAIANYTFFRRDSSRVGHTGLGLYIHNDIIHFTQRRYDLESDEVESLWIELKRQPQEPPTLIAIIYRNPVSSLEWYDSFVQMMDAVTEKHPKSNILMLGDFNIDLLKPHTAWESTCTLFGLKQLVSSPTRITPTSSTLIDHVYTNNTSKISDVSLSDIALSDHCPVICTMAFKSKKTNNKGHTTIQYRCFKNFDSHHFSYDLNKMDLQNVYNCNHPDDAVSVIYDAFIPIIDKHAPLRRKRVKQATLPGWLSGEIIQTMKERDMAKKHKNNLEFKRLRNKVSTLVRDAKRKFFSTLITNNRDTAQIWKAMNAITHKHRKTNPSPLNTHSADTFNDFFLSQANTIIPTSSSTSSASNYSSLLSEYCKQKLNTNRTCPIPEVTVLEVGNYIHCMPNKKSTGPDNISAQLLKTALPYLIEPLTYMYNMCIKQNIFPQAFKSAKVIPLEKKRGSTDLNNFRPISLLTILSKPLEKHIQTHILQYMENYNLFHNFQSGFRKQHSCHTALVRLCDTWLQAINNSKMTGAIFLDFKKAFDLVDHDLLVNKLLHYLNNKSTVALLSSFLRERTQRVIINGVQSRAGTVTCGVPQGSVLGPILFCIYINDLPLHISNQNVSCDLFADDSSLHSQSSSVNQLQVDLQEGIEDVIRWCSNNKMVLNSQKTKSMIITTRQKRQRAQLNLDIMLGKDRIEQIDHHRVLGVTIDEDLNWQNHIDNVRKKVAKNLYLLRKLTYYVDNDAQKAFFSAHCLSHINYASTLWCGASQNTLKKLHSLHRRGLRLLSNSQKNQENPCTRTKQILQLDKQFQYNIAILVFKVRKNLAPEYLSVFLTEASSRYGSENYVLPRTRVDLYKTSFSFFGSTVWNSLPLDVKQSNSLRRFKAALKQHLLRT
jgi:Reverse transcriptase (RNA-dependent DNA polymerase)